MSKLAMISYVAVSVGYYGGRFIEEGEVFPADFREVARDESKPPLQREQYAPNGSLARPAIYPIKRDKQGNAARLEKLVVPEWAVAENEADIPDQPDDHYVAPDVATALQDKVDKPAKTSRPARKAKAEPDEEGGDDGDEGKAPDGLDRMNRDALIGYATEKGIDLGDLDKVTKADMVAAIRAAASAAA